MLLIARFFLIMAACWIPGICNAADTVWVPVIGSNGEIIWIPGIKNDDNTIWIQLNADHGSRERDKNELPSRAPEKDGKDKDYSKHVSPYEDRGYGNDRNWTNEPSDYENRRFVPDRDK